MVGVEPAMRTFLLFCVAMPRICWCLLAQTAALDCRNSDAPSCEVREVTISAIPQLKIDSGRNGAISVRGEDRPDILILARIETSSKRAGVELQITDGVISAGPQASVWRVTYEILVPRKTDIQLKANNGGLAVDGITGSVLGDTVNGGLAVSLRQGARPHEIRLSTRNGGVAVAAPASLKLEKSGHSVTGENISISTLNGGVVVSGR